MGASIFMFYYYGAFIIILKIHSLRANENKCSLLKNVSLRGTITCLGKKYSLNPPNIKIRFQGNCLSKNYIFWLCKFWMSQYHIIKFTCKPSLSPNHCDSYVHVCTEPIWSAQESPLSSLLWSLHVKTSAKIPATTTHTRLTEQSNWKTAVHASPAPWPQSFTTVYKKRKRIPDKKPWI